MQITPCLPLLPAAEHHRPSAGTHFTVPQRVEGWVDLGGWLHTKIKCRLQESNPDTVTHPSTNWAQRRLTLLIETNALPLRQTATYLPTSVIIIVFQMSRVSCFPRGFLPPLLLFETSGTGLSRAECPSNYPPQCNERNLKQWHQPEKINRWRYPFFIHQWTHAGRGAARFMPTLWSQLR